MQSVTIGSNQAGQRLDKFLHKYLPQAGNGFLYKMLRKKNITLNGRKAEGAEMLSLGDQVCFFFSEETFLKFAGREIPPNDLKEGACNQNSLEGTVDIQSYQKAYRTLAGITVLYEDPDILVLGKPAGILSQKAAPGDLSLNEWMIGYLLKQNPSFQRELVSFHPSVCNRLDRNTSGIVLCGKSLAGTQYLGGCIREHSIRKFYRTICVGEVREEANIQGYLEKDTARNKVKVTGSHRLTQTQDLPVDPAMPEKDSQKGNYIHTRYMPLCTAGGYTLLEVELFTGKPHQIRAHLAGEGYPLAGDPKYGKRQANQKLKQAYGLDCQLLHACRVEFDGKVICAPCPELFLKVQKGLGLEFAGNEENGEWPPGIQGD